MALIGEIVGQEVRNNRDGGVDVRLLQVRISNDSDIQTVQYMPTSGDDSPPQNGDNVVVIGIGPAFQVAFAVQDSVVPSMVAGEKKLYSRDSGGAISAFINFLASGILELNGNADFAVRFSNLETMITNLNTKYDAHTHADPVSGSTGIPSNAPLGLDISGAKIDEIKVP